MSSKLEDRLLLYERDHPIRNDEDLIAALESFLRAEDALPAEQKDFDLIAEAVETVLELQGYSEEQLTEMADEAAATVKARIASKQKSQSRKGPPRRHRVLRWLIPVAVVLSLTVLAVFASPTNRLAISEMTTRLFLSLDQNTVHHEDSLDMIITQNSQEFSSLEDLSVAFDHTILLPFDLENEFHELSILVVKYGEAPKIWITFDYENSDCSIVIRFLQQSPKNQIERNARIGKFDVTIYENEGDTAADWITNQENYQVTSSSSEALQSIITSMRLKNE